MVVSARESLGKTFVTGVVILITLANADRNYPLRPLYKAVWSKKRQADIP